MLKNKIIKIASIAVSVIMITSGTLPIYATDNVEVNDSNNNSKKVIIKNQDNVTLEEELKKNEGVLKTEDVPQTDEDFTLIYKDIKNHWAKEAFIKAYKDGIIKGFEDKTMRPDSTITPAQMITVITRMLNSNLQASVEEYGIKDDCWYKDALSKALASGIVDKSDIVGMDDKMSRKDSVIMMSKAFQLSEADSDFIEASKYSDFSNLNLSEKIIYASLINKNYIQGWDGKLQLGSGITRAEFITILYRVINCSIDLDENLNLLTTESPALASGKKLFSLNANINRDLWLDGKVEEIDIQNSLFNRLFLMSDNISSISIKNSIIERLVIASKKGDINLDCSGIKIVTVGDGGGIVTLDPKGNDVEITGDCRTVCVNGVTRKIAVSGNSNNVSLPSIANSESIVIYGDNSIINVDCNIKELVIKGKNNIITGNGTVENLTIYNNSSKIEVNVKDKIDNIDTGIDGMTITVSAPEKLKSGNYLTATLNLNNPPKEKKYVKITWYLEGKAVTSENMEIPSKTKPLLYYYVDYSTDVADTMKVYCKVEYTTSDGKYQSSQSSTASVKIEKPYVPIKATVETTYKGNYTTQWAISHNLSNADKENFVNSKGYSSSSKYLIWVNIGTQYTSVFSGSKGKWKLIRSGLVSTGANDCTPRGVFKTTYKQTNWTTDTYTVKPIVRFYGGGYAMHSRLYKPGTTELKSGNNGVGYPLSHGCVRMQADDIQWIYDNVPNGTTIVVY